MGMKDKFFEGMLNQMSADEKKAMMGEMMDKFFAGMTAEDKQRMMEQMMPKMMEGINMAEMMPRMMMGMMGHRGKQGPKPAGAPHAMGGHHPPDGPPMMGHMMTQMMPGCVDMMMPVYGTARRRIATKSAGHRPPVERLSARVMVTPALSAGSPPGCGPLRTTWHRTPARRPPPARSSSASTGR